MQNATVKEQLIRSAKVFVAQYHNPETEKVKYQQLVKVLLDGTSSISILNQMAL